MSRDRIYQVGVVFEHDVLTDSSDEVESTSATCSERDEKLPSAAQNAPRSLGGVPDSIERARRDQKQERYQRFDASQGTRRMTSMERSGTSFSLAGGVQSERSAGAVSAETADNDEALFQKFCASLLAPSATAALDELLFEDDGDFELRQVDFENSEPNEEYRADTGARISSEELYQLVAEDCQRTLPGNEMKESAESFRSTTTPHRAFTEATPRRPRVHRESPSVGNASCERERLFQMLKFKLFKPEQERELSKQLHIHVQLLLHILLISSQRRANIDLSPEHVVHRQRAREAAWMMLDDLRRKRDVAREYRRALGGIERTFFDAMPLDLLEQIEQLLVKPALSNPDGLVTAVEAKRAYAVLESHPSMILPEYRLAYGVDIESDPNILRALASSADAELFWTEAEDTLLERCLSRHGVMWQEHIDDYLPHRNLEECVGRYRLLTRRDAPANPIKTLKLKAQQPLSVQEIELLRHGVMTYGECWDAIQAFLLPGRDKVLLERVWRRVSIRARKELRRRRRRQEASLRQASGEGLQRTPAPVVVHDSRHVTERPRTDGTEARHAQTERCQELMWEPFSPQEDRELLLLARQYLGSMSESAAFELVAQKMQRKRPPEAYRARACELIALL
ncbi:hypothetical protein, conserved [Cyanidioschyzon merolae strain 10D]|jgi:hypothetical protein|uniref:Myb-like domain-containing protein n=1 Tax=Cyanidioschyzon merolae (strain NIES-3377 / 10D) TaxID=280699 RepID=M1VHD8_CYAM1|nr:hypothetical protein, conserved [Cyanidioschyzon merolae strain 10D]BAM82747.1 hypothetical protein, conserved [Cyanidioschyzon merolae strain 10D]|eukprot:XP_005538783.1 hypothetical protein, conserved [Cyanidioschyzon merolae strain 10D]